MNHKTRSTRKSPQSPEQHNQAFIDGQNLYFNTKANSWTVDLKRFRVYLQKKYHVDKAYYFLGYLNEDNQDLYSNLQEAGFILVFRKHQQNALSRKKGNVDTDIVFSVMRKLYNHEDFDKVILVSGDGDYYRLVHFLREEEKLGKILFPSQKNASSLYRLIEARYRAYLDTDDVKRKIAHTAANKTARKSSISKKRDLLR